MRISNSNPQPGEQQIGATIQSNNATKEGLAGQPTSDQRKGKRSPHIGREPGALKPNPQRERNSL